MKQVYLFTNTPAHYRTSLWAKLLKAKNFSVHFYYGENKKDGIKLIDFFSTPFKQNRSKLTKLKNYWLNGRILVWQSGIISRCAKDRFDIGIFLGDFHCLSTWIASLITKIRGKRVIFWGHGFYGKESKIILFLRKLFFKLADQHLVYERRSKNIMVEHGFSRDSVYVVFNSLNYARHKELRSKCSNVNKNELYPFFENSNLPILLFIGRLTKIKKLDLLVKAVNTLNNNIIRYNLLFIGTGSEENILMNNAKVGIKNKYIHFLGECYSDKKISSYLYNSDLCVSPGNIGLTAIHSLSFGLPICTHDNLNYQMPEAEAIESGKSGLFFIEDDLNDLIRKIESWILLIKNRDDVRIHCYDIIDKYYNPSYQASVFERAIEGIQPSL